MRNLKKNEIGEVLSYGIHHKKKLEITKKLEVVMKKVQKCMTSKKYNLFVIGFFAGGCIRDLINEEQPADYDIFLKEKVDVNKLETAFHKKYIVCKTINALTLSIDGIKVQIVTVRYGHPVKTVSGFDFNVNKNFYNPSDSNPISNFYVQDFMSIRSKRLCVCEGIDNPFDAIYRLNRLGQKGYQISRKEFIKLVEQVRDLSKPDLGFYGRLVEEYENQHFVEVEV